MNIAIDFDDTFTAAPAIFAQLAKSFEDVGDSVFIVTNLDESFTDMIREILREHCLVLPIVCCGASAKKWFCEGRGIRIDIWIDDCPERILHGL